MNHSLGETRWSLEVLRGRDVGRRYPLQAGSVVVGNEVDEGRGLNLAEQEGNSPRKMAARQASIKLTDAGLVLLDLESPGGTFVNRKRVLAGQGQPLREGDVIQMGGVQLRVVAGAKGSTKPGESKVVHASTARSASAGPAASLPPERPPAPPPPIRGAVAPLAFSIQGGPTCRSWDDFITVSAQRWGMLREELTSGRLAAYLVSSGRADFAPEASVPGSPDDRLDAWLGSLPTSKPARPELEIHPRTLRVKAMPGASTRLSFRISNVGFRLLRSKVRVESGHADWLKIAPEFVAEFATVDETNVVVHVVTPESFKGPLNASVVVESNGGSGRVAVSLEAPGVIQDEPPGAVDVAGQGEWAPEVIWDRFSGWLARRGGRSRLLGGALAGVVLRLGIGVASGFSAVATLPGPALVLAAIGGILGGGASFRRGGPMDAPPGAFAGAFGGVMVSALLVAMCQAVEPVLGSIGSSSLIAVVVFWGVLGAGLGGGSLLVVPERPMGKGRTP